MEDSRIKVCSFDPSLTGFGVSAGDKETIEISTSPNNEQSQAQNLQRRCQEIGAKILAFINRNYAPDDELLVVVEMPSYGSHGALFEAGWMLAEIYNRFVINMTGGRRAVIVEVAPTQLKKWATGNGGPDKGKLRMKVAIKEKWGKEFERDPKGNKTDAYALYKYGIALLNGEITHERTPRRGSKKKNAKRTRDTKKSSENVADKPVKRPRRTTKASRGS